MDSTEAKKILQKALRNRSYPEGPGDEATDPHRTAKKIFRFIERVAASIDKFFTIMFG